MTNSMSLLKEIFGQENSLIIPKILVRLTGGLEPALLLNQIVFWSGKKQNGWFYKSYEDWEEEICLSEYLVRKRTRRLEKLGVVETKVAKDKKGVTKKHYRVLPKPLIDKLNPLLEGEQASVPEPKKVQFPNRRKCSSHTEKILLRSSSTSSDRRIHTVNCRPSGPTEINGLLAPKKDNVSPRSIEEVQAEKLYKALSTAGKIQRRPNYSDWVANIEALHTEDGVPKKTITVVLDWYCKNLKDPWVPAALSGRGFRERFDRIADCKQRREDENGSSCDAVQGTPPTEIELSQTAAFYRPYDPELDD